MATETALPWTRKLHLMRSPVTYYEGTAGSRISTHFLNPIHGMGTRVFCGAGVSPAGLRFVNAN